MVVHTEDLYANSRENCLNKQANQRKLGGKKSSFVKKQYIFSLQKSKNLKHLFWAREEEKKVIFMVK